MRSTDPNFRYYYKVFLQKAELSEDSRNLWFLRVVTPKEKDVTDLSVSITYFSKVLMLNLNELTYGTVGLFCENAYRHFRVFGEMGASLL